MCTARLFLQWVYLFAVNFTWTESSPATIFGVRKLEPLGYSMVT